ncbi:MAG: polysaccharide deacetylase family protein, partial [Alphaproteobacteria bacterium]
TAGENAAKILEDHGARGTFYTCFDLLGTDSPSGVIASIDMVRALSEKGHEIGCHTYDHINCSFVGGKRAAESCATNKKAAAALGIRMDHFAYPQGGMSPATKKVMKENFISARSILPGINQGTLDRHCLKSVPFYERYSHEDIFNRIDQVDREDGWLILYTHDVSANPSRYGASEQLFQKAVSYCTNKNLPIKTIREFLKQEN